MTDALWTPSPERIIRANMTEFLRYVEERGGPPVADYSPESYWRLYEWSLANPERFWSLTWRFCGIVGHRGTGGSAERVGVGLEKMEPPDPEHGPRWFPDADLNFAECEIVFVEFLGDLVKLHLMAEGERMLAKVPGEDYARLRGREGEPITITWKEEDVQLLRE